MNDITKLPQWAQRKIERLENDMAQMEADIAAIVGATPTAVEVDHFRSYRNDDGRPRLYLPERYPISFSAAGGRIDVQLKDGEIAICGQRDYGDFVVAPKASNVVHVHFATKIKETTNV